MGEALIKTQIDELLTGSCGRVVLGGGKGAAWEKVTEKVKGRSRESAEVPRSDNELISRTHRLYVHARLQAPPPSWRHINHGGSAMTYMCAHFPSAESNNGNAWMCVRIQYCYLQRASVLPVFVFSAVCGSFVCKVVNDTKKSSGESVPQKEAAREEENKQRTPQKFSFSY